MTLDEKVELLITLLDASSDASDKLEAFLQIAEKEILSWRYSYAGDIPKEVPPEYEMTQINAVIAGFNLSGAENQTQHSENGIQRTFKHADMLAYIRSNVIPIAGVF
jgi:hypothetical protein